MKPLKYTGRIIKLKTQYSKVWKFLTQDKGPVSAVLSARIRMSGKELDISQYRPDNKVNGGSLFHSHPINFKTVIL